MILAQERRHLVKTPRCGGPWRGGRLDPGTESLGFQGSGCRPGLWYTRPASALDAHAASEGDGAGWPDIAVHFLEEDNMASFNRLSSGPFRGVRGCSSGVAAGAVVAVAAMAS